MSYKIPYGTWHIYYGGGDVWGVPRDMPWGYSENFEMRENLPFEATLTFVKYALDSQSRYFIWKDAQDVYYPMFENEIPSIIQHGVGDGGTISALWIFKKRGPKFGIALAGDET